MRYPKYGLDKPPEGMSCDCSYEIRPETLEDSTTTTETPKLADTSIAWFKAHRSCGLLKKEEWIVNLTTGSAEFSLPGSGEHITVPRNEANARIEFPHDFSLFPSVNIHIKQDGKEYAFVLDRGGRSKLLYWLPRKTAAELKDKLRKGGIGLIVLGGAHLALVRFLDPVWGVLIAGIGILNLLIPKRGMVIVNGIALLLAGILNMSAVGAGGWKIFGMLQIVWGIQEIRKFSRYA